MGCRRCLGGGLLPGGGGESSEPDSSSSCSASSTSSSAPFPRCAPRLLLINRFTCLPIIYSTQNASRLCTSCSSASPPSWLSWVAGAMGSEKKNGASDVHHACLVQSSRFRSSQTLTPATREGGGAACISRDAFVAAALLTLNPSTGMTVYCSFGKENTIRNAPPTGVSLPIQGSWHCGNPIVMVVRKTA